MAEVKRTVRYWLLSYVDGKSDKFYAVFLSGKEVVLNWGRSGTSGQSSWDSYGTEQEAENVALRQVYAKMGKKDTPYKPVIEDTAFEMDPLQWNRAKQSNWVAYLTRSYQNYRDQNRFVGEQTRVQKHFQEFTTRATDLVARIQTQSFETALPDYDALKESWEALESEHQAAAAAMSLLEMTMQQRLMSGA